MDVSVSFGQFTDDICVCPVVGLCNILHLEPGRKRERGNLRQKYSRRQVLLKGEMDQIRASKCDRRGRVIEGKFIFISTCFVNDWGTIKQMIKIYTHKFCFLIFLFPYT